MSGRVQATQAVFDKTLAVCLFVSRTRVVLEENGPCLKATRAVLEEHGSCLEATRAVRQDARGRV